MSQLSKTVSNLVSYCCMKNGVRRKAYDVVGAEQGHLGKGQASVMSSLRRQRCLQTLLLGLWTCPYMLLRQGRRSSFLILVNVGTWLQEPRQAPCYLHWGTKAQTRLGMQFLKLLHKCPGIWNGNSSKIWGILRLTVGITRLQCWKLGSKGWRLFSYSLVKWLILSLICVLWAVINMPGHIRQIGRKSYRDCFWHRGPRWYQMHVPFSSNRVERVGENEYNIGCHS